GTTNPGDGTTGDGTTNPGDGTTGDGTDPNTQQSTPTPTPRDSNQISTDIQTPSVPNNTNTETPVVDDPVTDTSSGFEPTPSSGSRTIVTSSSSTSNITSTGTVRTTTTTTRSTTSSTTTTTIVSTTIDSPTSTTGSAGTSSSSGSTSNSTSNTSGSRTSGSAANTTNRNTTVTTTTPSRTVSSSGTVTPTATLAAVEENLASGDVDGAINTLEGSYVTQVRSVSRRNSSPTLLSASHFQDRLMDIAEQTGQTSVIIYVLARPEQLDLIAIAPTGERIYASVPDANREALMPVMKELRRNLTNPRQRNTTSYLASAQQLYQWLIAPLEPELQRVGADTLVFSMDEGLRTLPIAALHDGKQFLIEKYSLGLIPSINLTDTSYQPLRGSRVLAMGASQFRDQIPLPAVPIELSTIVRGSALVPDRPIEGIWPGKAFLNEAFTLENLKEQRNSSRYRIVHLATHAEFQAGKPENSYIQFWDRKLGLDRLRELGWNDYPVDLLVLSACRTAVGDGDSELGFAGFAVQAGVKSVLASLWYVSDEGTLGLMAEFYQKLQQAGIATKAEALRQAQLAMLRGELRVRNGELVEADGSVPLPPELADTNDRALSHPYYWSGFTMVGSPW
ncbi:MAG TPA: CHAT domain-containing protein, partial [Oscillatoriales cyanobacterium M59_W2019_021]|nr:CHAT domain-containing protein [Oscillatoriales cyanobacterium M59_W2019_021]